MNDNKLRKILRILGELGREDLAAEVRPLLPARAGLAIPPNRRDRPAVVTSDAPRSIEYPPVTVGDVPGVGRVTRSSRG